MNNKKFKIGDVVMCTDKCLPDLLKIKPLVLTTDNYFYSNSYSIFFKGSLYNQSSFRLATSNDLDIYINELTLEYHRQYEYLSKLKAEILKKGIK